MGSSNGMLGPFFLNTETYEGCGPKGEPKDNIWGNKRKVEVMKSIWKQDALDDRSQWGNGNRSFPCNIGMEESLRRSESAAIRACHFLSANTEPLQHGPNFMPYPVLAPSSGKDDLLSTMCPKVTFQQEEPTGFDFLEGDRASSLDVVAPRGKFELELGACSNQTNVWDFDPIPKRRCESVASGPLFDPLEYFQSPSNSRNFSMGSMGSDESSSASHQSIQSASSSNGNNTSLSLSPSDLDELTNFVRDDHVEFNLAARFQRACTTGDVVRRSRPARPGSTRSDLEDFSRKFGYAGKPKQSLMYRPRKGKYRKEF